jgi:hypothetical protein
MKADTHYEPIERAKYAWLIDLFFIVAYLVMGYCFFAAIAGCTTVGKLVPRAPVLAQCDALCTTSCLAPDGDTGIRWDGTPVDAKAWDALAGETVPALTDKLRTCERHRKACTQCLDRLEQQKVITQ